ncbi:mannitol dehydrogenase family protein [Psychromonas sp. SR45-3]|uniref:mannitol dehydrogenase family protein n=1 Tax=Psychromonas sp. SR45-3 TaxID=2760930 RepID=UPI0015F82FD0|nr:mannitol dehydrogenase family protein [Psychromonas sp. SR45-3]MBB1271896.1 mannitol dehydrogenase family protein [Psychromonas sp. SR45-3]
MILNKTSLKQAGFDTSYTANVGVGIVHLGFGAFHKAHQAWLTDRVIQELGGNWKIVGVNNWGAAGKTVSETGKETQYSQQDNLFSICETDNQDTKIMVVGSIEEVLFSNQTNKIMSYLTAETTKVVTLTITEKGYCHLPSTGRLNLEHPLIKHDLKNINSSKTAIGFLVSALQVRMLNGIKPFTPLSCDNLPENGHTLRDIVYDFAQQLNTELHQWIVENVTFPCTMVDRIVPKVTDNDKNKIQSLLHLRDECGVITEPFCQWIIEDNFCNNRPDWDKTSIKNIIFTDDVLPFEEMKLRLLNGAHSIIAYLGCLSGYETVSDALQDKTFKSFVRSIMDYEITPSLSDVEGVDLENYKSLLIERFENTSLNHKTSQIAMDGSQKIPQRWLSVIKFAFDQQFNTPGLSLALAAWVIYSRGETLSGETIEVHDPLKSTFKKIWEDSNSIDQVIDQYLSLNSIFPSDIASNVLFKTQLTSNVKQLISIGVDQSIEKFAQIKRSKL